ncbi:MAG: 2-isopropylmalate synthase [Magnetococcales bacterium]|nr:2-isopropylmalate synthase [Magnetococcales bacterium]
MTDKIIIFDTTLRDGEQSPGASMNVDEKLRIAQQLERLQVDVIEAGFPIASPGDFAAVKGVAAKIKNCSVAGLCRASFKDIDRAWEALSQACDPRLHIFIATSPIHMQHKLNMTPDQVLERAVEAVKYGANKTSNIEWSAEDAGRTDMDFLCRIVEAVIAAGAKTINIPDTVGYTLPDEFGERINMLMNRVSNIDQATISVHCHNDLGLAVANSLSAINNGARQVECTINGLGERAGNASLEEVVMSLRTRRDLMPYKCSVDTREIINASRLVANITGIEVQLNKAIVGANAFAHEAGIHQDGVLKEAATYEIMTPESVGLSANRIVLGKHSGRHAFRDRLATLGYHLTDDELNRAFKRFKDLADKKQDLFDADLAALVEDEVIRATEYFKLLRIHVASGTQDTPVAAVEMEIRGEHVQGAGWGTGTVDAAFKSIAAIVPEAQGVTLDLYRVEAITGGTDAQAKVVVRLTKEENTYQGLGAHNDVVEASARAYVNALNRLVQIGNKLGKKQKGV